MYIPNSGPNNKIPEPTPGASRAETGVQQLAAQAAEAADSETYAAQAIPADVVEADCPGHEKPTIIDLFPELDPEGPGITQTLRYPEDGEFPVKPPTTQTLRYPEDGEFPVKPPTTHTLRYPEDGEFPVKPPIARTAAIGEDGSHFGKPSLRTAAMGEYGDDFAKPGKKDGPILRTAAMGEYGDDWGKPFKPGKPGGLKPWFDPPITRTLAYPENGDSEFLKRLKENLKPHTSPPCKCWPEKDEFPQGDFPLNRTMAYTGEGGDDQGPKIVYTQA
ncbi:MAG: hypothetical protein ACAI44_11770 [Candidatus Sericytochromatia bacterium]